MIRSVRCQNLRELEAAGDLVQEQQSSEQREATGGGHRERHACAFARVLTLVPVADQQERREAGEFPEDEEEQKVLGHHDAEHRAHEEHEQAKETAHRVCLGQVIARVEDDEQADAEDEARKEERETVESEREAQAELGEPGPAHDDGFASEHGRRDLDDEGKRCGRERCRRPCGGRAPEAGHERE